MDTFTVVYSLDGHVYLDMFPGLTWDYDKCLLITSSVWKRNNETIKPEMMRIVKVTV